ncbi:MAG: hypothetical protein R2764_01570 [Bacteroidales bacterium]
MSESVKYTIELIDGFGKPMRGVIQSADDLNRKVRGVKKPVGDLSKSFSTLQTQLKRYQIQRDESFRTDHIRRYNRMIEETRRQIRNLESETGTCGTKSNNLFTRYKGIIGLTGGFMHLARE